MATLATWGTPIRRGLIFQRASTDMSIREACRWFDELPGKLTPKQNEIAARIRRALRVLPPERIMVNPDCGLRNLPSDIALAKLRALGAGTAIVRAEVLGK